MGKKKETKEEEKQAQKEVEEPKRLRKETVCIVGCSDSKRDTPFHKAGEYEFWGVNNLFLSLPGPYTRWFEIHSLRQDETGKWLRRGEENFRGQPVDAYLRDLSKLPCPVFMQKPNPLVPNSISYPYQQIVAMFGDYFTNTISWEIALAIAEGFKEIKIFGVDMAVDTEWEKQRPSCELFLGIAIGRGIKVHVPDDCDLMKTRFKYGFEDEKSLAWDNKINAMQKKLEEKHNQAQQQAAFHQKQADQYVGALLSLKEGRKIWKNVQGG